MLSGKKSHFKACLISECMDHIFKKYTSKIAVIDESSSFTFDEIHDFLNYSIPNVLDSLFGHFDRQVRIAVMMNPIAWRSIVSTGIIYLNHCYIPLDPTYPFAKLEHILNDSSPDLIITDDINYPVLKNKTNIIHYSCFELHKAFSTAFVKCDWKNVKQNLPAYMIYTSGSTGLPKGVVISQRALINQLKWLCDEFCITPEDSILFRTATMFDPSVWELLLPFFSGCSQFVASLAHRNDMIHLQQLLSERKITLLQLVPSLFRLYLSSTSQANFPHLRICFLGGETIDIDIKMKFFEIFHSTKLINLYGPTEATIQVTWHEIQNTTRDIRENIIGVPIKNTRIFVIKNDFDIVGPGEYGEIYIQGEALAEGYWNDQARTQRSFIDTKYGLLYKTGDIGMVLDGLLYYIGRKDDQMKIAGNRIYPSEMRHLIMSKFSEVEDFLILEDHITGRIVGYLKASKRVSINQLKAELLKFYPAAVIPKSIHVLSEFPVLENGKRDYRSLKAIDNEYLKRLESKNSEDMITPTAVLKTIWHDLLRNEIDEDTDFFECGGDSLTALQLICAIKERLEISITLSDVMLNQKFTDFDDLVCSRIQLKYTSPKSCVYRLTAPVSGCSLVLVHPIGGSIFGYRDLAKMLNGHVNVLAIEDPDLSDFAHPHFESMDDIAKYYVHEIIPFIRDADFLIGGASFGTNVAFAMTKYLIDQGHTPKVLISFDGWGHYPDTLYDADVFERLMKQHYHGLFISTDVQVKQIEALHVRRLNMLKIFSLPKIDIPTVLFKSTIQNGIFERFERPDNFLKEACQHSLKVVNVLGDHYSLLDKVNLSTYIDIILNLCLNVI